MARSNETFSKKEKEKKKAKKQLDKKEKAAERKANAVKGGDLNDMMAYVDQDGNITSTPPSYQKSAISADDIQIATPKQVNIPGEQPTGVISFFNTDKGYGFIRDDKTRENVFFHVNNLQFQAKENDKVKFLTEKGPKGLSATKIEKA